MGRLNFSPTWMRRGGYSTTLHVGTACAAADLTEFGRMTRQYRLNAPDLVESPCAPMAAWYHLAVGTPWRVDWPLLDCAIVHAYRRWKPGMRVSLSVGAREIDCRTQGVSTGVRVIQLESVQDIESCLVRGVGPVALGVQWRTGLELPDALGVLHADGKHLGGHAVTLTGADLHRGVVRVTNNRGVLWGQAGRAWLSVHELAAIMRDGFEAYTILPLTPIAKTAKPDHAKECDG